MSRQMHTDRRALRVLMAAGRPLPIRASRTPLDAPYLSHLAVQTFGSITLNWDQYEMRLP